MIYAFAAALLIFAGWSIWRAARKVDHILRDELTVRATGAQTRKEDR